MSWDDSDWENELGGEQLPTPPVAATVGLLVCVAILGMGLLVGCVGLAFGAPIYVDGQVHGELEQCDADVERLECVTVRRVSVRPTPTRTPFSCPPGTTYTCGFRCDCLPIRTATPAPTPSSTARAFAGQLDGTWYYGGGPKVLEHMATAWNVYSRVSTNMANAGQARLAPEVFWQGIAKWNAPEQDVDAAIWDFERKLGELCPGEHCPDGVVFAEPSTYGDAQCRRVWGECASLPPVHGYYLERLVELGLEPAVVPYTFRWPDRPRSRLDPIEIWLEWLETDAWMRRLAADWPEIRRAPIQLSNGTVPDAPNREPQLSLLAWGLAVIQQRYGFPPELQIELGRDERDFAPEWDCEAYRAARRSGAAVSVFDHARLQALAEASDFPC